MIRLTYVVLVGIVLAACSGPGTQGPGQSGQPSGGNEASAPKVLTASITEDPRNMWDGINGGGGSGARELGPLLNQYLVAIKADGNPEVRLLAEAPSQNNGLWQVNPDGTMQVTYKLRPGVTWHDGTPFTADDMVFSWQVGRDPAIPNGNQSAVKLIKSMEAADPQTAVATWSQTYPFADRLEEREFYPVPAHLLSDAFAGDKTNFAGQSYFSDNFVGLGPFKLTQWEHGSALDMEANDSFFLGRPKIDRIHVMFIADPNTVIANLRAGSVNLFLPPGGPAFDAYQPLRDEWTSTRQGTILNESIRWTMLEIQKRPGAAPSDLTDARVRQALLMGINRQELATELLGDLGVVSDSWEHPRFAYFPQIKDDITSYPYDPAKAASLLRDVGWTPGSDGVLTKAGDRFQFTITYTTETEVATVLASDFKAIGVDPQINQLTPFQLRDAQARASFTGGDVTNNPMGGLSAVRRFASEQTPTAQNGWAGTNRGAFSNPDWDRIGTQLRTSLQDGDRTALDGQLLKVFSAQLPSLPLYYEIQSVPTTGFSGLQPVTGVAHTGEIMHTTTAHLWTMS